MPNSPEAAAASHRAAVRAWKLKHPDRHRAHQLAHNARRRGELKRRPCEVCGRPAQGHHHDYSKPLDVTWMCPKHHAAEHRKAT